MHNKQLFVFVEPTYISSAWCVKSMEGLEDSCAKNHISLRILESFSDIMPARVNMVVLVSASVNWTHYMVKRMREMGIKTVIMGAFPNNIAEDVSGPLLNRRLVVESIVKYMYDCGKRKIASVGNDDTEINDIQRQQYFLGMVECLGLDIGEADIYKQDQDIDACVSHFMDNVQKYDAAVCVNDYVGVQVLLEAKKRNIRVPEDLFVAGSGDLIIGQCAKPTLTTTTLDYYTMGVQTLSIWKLLDENPAVTSANVFIHCDIISRESTAFMPVLEYTSMQPLDICEPIANLHRPVMATLHKIEKCLLACDPLDYSIVAGLLRNNSYEKIASDLFMAPGTVQYRLKKLYSIAGVVTRKKFVSMIGPYITNLSFLEKQ